jgi:hypothetical protein
LKKNLKFERKRPQNAKIPKIVKFFSKIANFASLGTLFDLQAASALFGIVGECLDAAQYPMSDIVKQTLSNPANGSLYKALNLTGCIADPNILRQTRWAQTNDGQACAGNFTDQCFKQWANYMVSPFTPSYVPYG